MAGVQYPAPRPSKKSITTRQNQEKKSESVS